MLHIHMSHIVCAGIHLSCIVLRSCCGSRYAFRLSCCLIVAFSQASHLGIDKGLYQLTGKIDGIQLHDRTVYQIIDLHTECDFYKGSS